MYINNAYKMQPKTSPYEFYYSCIFTDLNFFELKKHIDLNPWHFNLLKDEAKKQIKNKIEKLYNTQR